MSNQNGDFRSYGCLKMYRTEKDRIDVAWMSLDLLESWRSRNQLLDVTQQAQQRWKLVVTLNNQNSTLFQRYNFYVESTLVDMFLMITHDQILDKHTIVDMFLMMSHDQILDKHTIVDVFNDVTWPNLDKHTIVDMFLMMSHDLFFSLIVYFVFHCRRYWY
jgi:hypothetical protein